MKRILPCILIFCFLLSGCKQQTQVIPQDTQPPNPQISETEPSATQETLDSGHDHYTQQPLYSLSLPVITERTDDDEGSFTFQNIHLICQNQEVSDKIILDYLNRQDAHRKVFESRPNAQYSVIYEPVRFDSSIVSLYGQSVLHEGRNHPVVTCETINYNLITGEVLTLGSILENRSAYERLQDALLFAAETAADEMQLFDEYPQIIAERFSENPSFDEEWYFTNTGINFYFEPYEIAPYVSGVVVLEVPYERLLGIIDASYFPLEEDLSEGVLNVHSIDNIKLEEYTQIAEVYVNGYRKAAFVYCDGLVRDIRVEVIADSENPNAGTIFAASTLSPADGLILMYDQEGSNPILKITYRSGVDTITKNLYFSDDGSVVLT